MKQEAILITGANGEIGHSLITQIYESQNIDIVALDIHEPESELSSCCCEFIKCNIMDEAKLREIFDNFHFKTIYHLASLLSTRAENNPFLAQKVNVQGTANLLELAAQQSAQTHYSTKFIYPSSIAVFGMSSLEMKTAAGKISEFNYCDPITLYGCNKLACENLGKYYSTHYRLLDEDTEERTLIDFRSIRFPGLISAITTPTGGTSDYGPEMLHNAAQNLPYGCFVRPDATLPFMVMPDAVKALLSLEKADINQLTQSVYNVTSFNPSAQDLIDITKSAFPNAEIFHAIHEKRQAIVDSWPADIDDTAARKDWAWQPDYDLERAFHQYLIPNIVKKYQKLQQSI